MTESGARAEGGLELGPDVAYVGMRTMVVKAKRKMVVIFRQPIRTILGVPAW